MATYVDRVLEPGESVRYRTTVSWIVYIPSGALAAIALAALLARLHQLNAIFAILGASHRDKSLDLHGWDLRSRL